MKSMLVWLGRVKVESIGRLSCFVWAMGMIQFSSWTLFVGEMKFHSIALYLVGVTIIAN